MTGQLTELTVSWDLWITDELRPENNRWANRHQYVYYTTLIDWFAIVLVSTVNSHGFLLSLTYGSWFSANSQGSLQNTLSFTLEHSPSTFSCQLHFGHFPDPQTHWFSSNSKGFHSCPCTRHPDVKPAASSTSIDSLDVDFNWSLLAFNQGLHVCSKTLQFTSCTVSELVHHIHCTNQTFGCLWTDNNHQFPLISTCGSRVSSKAQGFS